MLLKRRKKDRVVPVRNAEEVELMAAAGAVVAQALIEVRAAAVPGISTAKLDKVAEDVIRASNAVPSFLGYHDYPASTCISVNDAVVHGIPSKTFILAEGDLVSVDCGAILAGWHGDSAITFGIGELAREDEDLSDATRDALWAGIGAMRPGNRLTDVSHAIEQSVAQSRAKFGRQFSIVANFGGHGIGDEMHLEPFLPNEGKPGKGPLLAVGSTLAIEPMVALGGRKSLTLPDGWTVVTKDGTRAAHWEHTVAVGADGPRVLTVRLDEKPLV
ncbi:type I methionyl aminopeptidase [Segniliparus rugosus]|uniref:Methionine aminopeptidase n=1 Tax=Segniliparus rugosus (strain ATCC BAA-974 / DSM 45345 / CCUG 50838 / CIP 108380 / JCM 13579 / CDC 945) TaxID=679197 RepID=E5XUR3_SEGRC|nr:type I methionyl aminopeptidase [Segniliparus rugosus]EFV11901.1 methionine aminopeptidase, type I [Segniliparus rugosus ATCC BAA-974]